MWLVLAVPVDDATVDAIDSSAETCRDDNTEEVGDEAVLGCLLPPRTEPLRGGGGAAALPPDMRDAAA